MSLVELARESIRRHAMLAGGEAVLVAVSGGADSVALLHVLRALAPSLSLRLSVAHVDHRLRADSARDAGFARDLARRLGLPVEVVAVDVPPGSGEEAARRARYAALDAVADRVGAARIAVGHTADDQAETVLMRLLQGAGPRGLAGIPPVRGRIIRPLLCARRADVVAALRRDGHAWIEDPSNADPRFLRNRIRHELLPLLARHQPDVVGALNRTARHMRGALETIDRLAATELARSATAEPDGLTLPLDRLRALPAGVAAEVLRQAAGRLGSRTPLRAWAYRGLGRVLADPPSRRPFRLGGLRLEVSSGQLRVARGTREPVEPRMLGVPGVTPLPEVGLALHTRLLAAAGYDVPRDRRVVAFDADRLPSALAVRARRRGDRFTPLGGPERRLKRFLIGAKVPRWERDTIPLVEAAGRIVWVAGLRRGDAAPVTAVTRQVLELALVSLAETPAAR